MRGRGLPRTGGECMCGVCDKVCVNMIVHVAVSLHLEILFSVRPCKNVQGISLAAYILYSHCSFVLLMIFTKCAYCSVFVKL